MREEQLRGAIKKIRAVIRYHRDQKGDDRCWLDDFLVWELLIDNPNQLKFSFDEGMKRCTQFYELRRCDKLELPAQAMHPSQWDEDVVKMDLKQLDLGLRKLQKAIEQHRSLTKRTFRDDQELYEVLPEKLPGDFRLPPRDEFLGTVKPNAGCPNFWKSHTKCSGKHNLHQWGPFVGNLFFL